MTTRKLQLQRARREHNQFMITQLDVLARQSMVRGSANIQGLRGISTIPIAPASLAVLNHIGSGATQGPMYAVQTLSLGVSPEIAKHDFLPQFAQGSVAWRAQKAPSSLLHLSTGPVATTGGSGANGRGALGGGGALGSSALGGGALSGGRSATPSEPLSGLIEQGEPTAQHNTCGSAPISRGISRGPPLRRPNSAFPSRSLLLVHLHFV